MDKQNKIDGQSPQKTKAGDMDSILTDGNLEKIGDSERLDYQSSSGSPTKDDAKEHDPLLPEIDTNRLKVDEDEQIDADSENVTVVATERDVIKSEQQTRLESRTETMDAKPETCGKSIAVKDIKNVVKPMNLDPLANMGALILHYDINSGPSRALKSILQVIHQSYQEVKYEKDTDVFDQPILSKIEFFPKTYLNSRDCFDLFEERSFDNKDALMIVEEDNRAKIEEVMEFYFNIFEPAFQSMFTPYRKRSSLSYTEFQERVKQSEKAVEICIRELERILTDNFSSIFILGKEPSMIDYMFFSQITDMYIFEIELYKDKQKYFRVKIWHDFCKQLDGLNQTTKAFQKEVPTIQSQLGITSKYITRISNGVNRRRTTLKNKGKLELTKESRYIIAKNESCDCLCF